MVHEWVAAGAEDAGEEAEAAEACRACRCRGTDAAGCVLVGTDERGGWQLLVTEVLHLRQSYQFYSREHAGALDAEYAAGVQLGLGFFASLFAFLPPRIAKIFEILGYYEAEPGMTHFMRAVNGPRCARAMFCEAIVMMLRLSIEPLLMGNELANKMEHDTMEVQEEFWRVPWRRIQSVRLQTIFWEDRYTFWREISRQSKTVHLEIIKTVDDWLPIRNVAFWEALQLACAEFDWESAAHHCGVLLAVVDGHLPSLHTLKVSLNGPQGRVTMRHQGVVTNGSGGNETNCWTIGAI